MRQFWQSLPLSLKKALPAICIVLVLTGVFNEKILDTINGIISEPLSSDTQPERIEVDFVIKDNNFNPVQGARISFQWQGAVEVRVTDSNGFVRINIPKRNDIEVTITKPGFKTQLQTINLDADINRTVTYFIEKAEEPSDNGIEALVSSLHVLLDDGEDWKQKINEGTNPEPEIYPYYIRVADEINVIDKKCDSLYSLELLDISRNTNKPDLTIIEPNSKERVILNYHSFLLSQQLELLKTARSFVRVSC